MASIATAWRAVEATTAFELRAIPEAMAAAGRRSGRLSAGDSSCWTSTPPCVNSYSEKQDAAPTYKKGFGFFPLGVWCDTTHEPLAAMLRPGNTGANDTDDHIELFDRALSGLPEEYQAGHFEGDHPALVIHPILVRADSAGATHGFVDAIRVPTATSPSDSPSTREFVMPCSSSKKRTGSRPERPTARSGTAPG